MSNHDKFLESVNQPFNKLDPHMKFRLYEYSLSAVMEKISSEFLDECLGIDGGVKFLREKLDTVYNTLHTIFIRAGFMTGMGFEEDYMIEVGKYSDKYAELGLSYVDSNVCASVLSSHTLLKKVCVSYKEATIKDLGEEYDGSFHPVVGAVDVFINFINNILENMTTLLNSEPNGEAVRALDKRGYKQVKKELDESNRSELPDAFKKSFGDFN